MSSQLTYVRHRRSIRRKSDAPLTAGSLGDSDVSCPDYFIFTAKEKLLSDYRHHEIFELQRN